MEESHNEMNIIDLLNKKIYCLINLDMRKFIENNQILSFLMNVDSSKKINNENMTQK
jgi:hypothetical protein